LERLPLAGILDDDRPAVAADVDERPLLPRLVSDDDDRNTARPAGNHVVLAEDADVLPRPAEDRVLLALQHRGVAVPAPRRRGHFSHLAAPRHRLQDARMSSVGEPEPIIYRTEVLAIIGALADIVVELRWLRDYFEEDDEEEEDEGRA
jgi:hypothetical protein